MTDTDPSQPSGCSTDTGAAFRIAMSTCAELEVLCGRLANAPVLALVGMVASVLTGYGARQPAWYVGVELDSVADGLKRLDGAVAALADHEPRLWDSLRAREARELVYDAIRLTV